MRRRFKNTYPMDPSKSLSVVTDKDSQALQVIDSDPKRSEVFADIASAINNYLKKNKGAADFNILKDIADRNSDSLESQIEATAPIPTYIGLCGTLVGIILGVFNLGFNGGITDLMTYAGEVENSSELGAKGIETLLAGVGVAMLTTLFGVIFSVAGSLRYKRAHEVGEYRKNLFLNWLQGELLPKMDDGIVTTLDILQKNLNAFNESFAENSKKLEEVFDGINTSYKGQAKLVEQVQSLKVSEMATANIKVLRELQQCTGEIVVLKEFLHQSNRYLMSVENLNSNLKDQYERTQLIEEMGAFFKDEIEQVGQRKAAISRAVADIDRQMSDAFKDLADHTAKQFAQLTRLTAEAQVDYADAIEKQGKALDQRLARTPTIAEELRNLTAVKDNIGKLVERTEYQNVCTNKLITANETIAEVCSKLVERSEAQSRQTDQLIGANSKIAAVCSEQKSILEKLGKSLAKADWSGGASDYSHVLQDPHQRHRIKIPLFYGIVGSLTCLVIVGTCAFFVVKALL